MGKKVRNNRIFRKYREGAASFYIVAISTLILVIIAASFAAVIISEVTRTSNDDLSQSAYDSALAGVEDAKLAFYQYQQCKNNSSSGSGCSDLIDMVEHPDKYTSEDNCDMVANALGRKIENNNDGTAKGVMVREGNTQDNNMEQFYTCVKIKAQTEDYLGVLDSEDPEHSVRVRFKKDGSQDDVAAANDVGYVRLSWHSFNNSSDSGSKGARFDWMTQSNGSIFGSEKKTPAVVSLTVLQTDETFDLSDFDMSNGANTDRGTLYFVPNDWKGKGSVKGTGGDSDNYIGIGYNDFINDGLAKSNDKMIKNKPYWVDCLNENTTTQDYACSVVVKIPQPYRGGKRNPDTFIVSVALPYGEPKTDYRLEFLKGDGSTTKVLDGVQISIDSTGRANDLFRRVDTRLEPADASYPYPIYGIEALDPNNSPGIEKEFDTTCEYNFDDPTCP